MNQSESQNETADPSPIAAIATALGPAGLGVVRISGAGSLALGDRLFPGVDPKPSQREGGTFFHARVVHPITGKTVDDAVALVFRPPHSYTGEEALEIQGHGGAVPPRRVLEAVLAAGARLAEAGEFTRRAFLNGRLDLVQAEAVCDFIQSKTERAATVARSQLDGWLGDQIRGLYERATSVCADVEHFLDFDESELPDSFLTDKQGELAELIRSLSRLSDSWNDGHLLRDGALVVISGRPNAGKSSLLNALLGWDRAIVSTLPGTTRDIIEESIAINGVPLRMVDTAGLRETDLAVEREGIKRARDWARQADLNIYLVDCSVPWNPAEKSEWQQLSPSTTVFCLTKCDLAFRGEPELPEGSMRIRLSVVSGEGMDVLRRAITDKLGLAADASDCSVVSLRQVSELRNAIRGMVSADRALKAGSEQLVIAANELRTAAEGLGRIVGRVYSDDLLDTIFSRFCVGK